MTDKPTLEARENGPLIAKHIPNLRMPDGTNTRPKDLVALCRCGKSQNKPFCDGAHKDAGFDGTPDPDTAKSKDRIYSYEGAQATVHFSKLLCSHAGECGKRARAIFNTKQRPWVKPDEGTLDQIKEVVAACPSGALRYSETADPVALTSDTVEIEVEPNGPLHIRNIPITADYWADGQSPEKYVLCRCGLSKNKPFCDGTHYDEGWKDQS